MTDEVWKPIPSYEGLYEVSSEGRIRALGVRRGRRSGDILKLDAGRIRLCRNGRYESVSVADLVAIIFPAPDLPGEEWLPVPDFEEFYEISSTGRVRRLANKRLLKPSENNGYLVAYLYPDGRKENAHKLYVERTIAALWPDLASTADIINRKATAQAASRRHKNTELVDLPGEEWRDIAGYEGLYRVSNLGRIMSLARMVGNRHGGQSYVRACIREPGSWNSGYPKIELAKDGKTKTVGIHQLVAVAFIPNPLGLEVVHHKDEDKTNCRASNLEWTTRGDNVRDWFDRRNGDAIRRAAEALGMSESDLHQLLTKKS